MDQMKRISHLVVVVVAMTTLFAGCDLLDPNRPASYQDTTVFGNLIERVDAKAEGENSTLILRVAVPRLLAESESKEGKAAPDVEDGLTAVVTVTPDTVILFKGLPANLDSLAPGHDLTVLPVPGTTVMEGTSRVLLEARYLADFESYRKWQLPNLHRPEDAEGAADDPADINSSGIEHSPVPVGDGRVLYFSARYRSPSVPGGEWHGAARDGSTVPADGQPPRERIYRTELEDEGWTTPAPVSVGGVDDATVQRASWVSSDEQVMLVTIEQPESEPWVGRCERSTSSDPWGDVTPVEGLGPNAYDAVYLAGSTTKIVFTTTRGGVEQSDLWMHDPTNPESPLPLEPRINTPANEGSPRTTPDGRLLFDRGDRQLLLRNGKILAVQVEGQHRALIMESNPTADEKYMFLSIPRLRPIEPDLDIFVAKIVEPGRLGPVIPVDDWRP